ncbi:acyl-CoA--6-aminopenicillanic acid acyltransferase [Virgibacillus sp. NKC19-3]|uniref:C45 family autoproteolytic acyltransferase/hydolase n=1 Tax=Virgibacillus saliphilus TaxID=2831674 RepID=UPI001C9AB9D1|nr:C45 family peptidase [Virgibacillus sp. NKC19-3]MBY7145070.1 acyl-CoA--6-aminopenicillanic acid acyltransferase [Virgibacillus sp. NKC19-3]
MKQFYSDVVQYRGTHYDFGYFQGELLRDSPILPNREKQWGPKKDRHFIIDSKTYKAIMTTFAPAILHEIRGLADALQMDMEDAFRLFGGYYLEYTRSGCSIFTDPNFMVRNYDSHPKGYEGRYMLYEPTDQGYAFIGPSMQITGRIDGMNEKGLVMGYNFTHSKKSGDGFLCNMIGRLILETCKNVYEAISLLREIPHRNSFSYVLLDPAGQSYVVEASPRQVEVRKSNVCTNHFHLLHEENRYRQDETRQREQTIQDQQKYATNPYQSFKVMNDPDYGVFSNKYDAAAGTIHTSTYFPKERKAWFVIGPDRKPVIFDFSKWLRGENVNVKQIKGELDYPAPFVNME